jgi:hypothetical protein
VSGLDPHFLASLLFSLISCHHASTSRCLCLPLQLRLRHGDPSSGTKAISRWDHGECVQCEGNQISLGYLQVRDSQERDEPWYHQLKERERECECAVLGRTLTLMILAGGWELLARECDGEGRKALRPIVHSVRL